MRYRILRTSLFALTGLGLFLLNGTMARTQQLPQYKQPQYQPPKYQQPQVPQPSKAAVNKSGIQGKYYDLQTILYVPKDREKYSNFCDWGYANSMDYAGYENVPAGYWVYNFPHWFIWQNMDASKDFSLQQASMNGKYAKLLEKLSVPEDHRKYGKFRDTGYQETTFYDGTPNLPPGYWVYHFPHWYIWAEQAKFGPKQ